MPVVTFTMRGGSEHPDIPPFETEGYAPFPTSPLVVARFASYDFADKKWNTDDSRWCVMHRATGSRLGGRDRAWRTRKEALAVLDKCDPTFPAWAVAIGRKEDAATVACFYKFKVALGVLA